MVLKVVKLPNMGIEHCITAAPLTFREYISSDKICAGYGSGEIMMWLPLAGLLLLDSFSATLSLGSGLIV